jgi:hypothetical protein
MTNATFITRVNGFSKNQCKEWDGGINKHGYGTVRIGRERKMWYVHRLAYTLFVGEILEGLQIDHLCRNRKCLNIHHLEPVTQKENMKRGITASKTKCKNGHAFDKANTYITPRGLRNCRHCNRDCKRRAAEKRKALK